MTRKVADDISKGLEEAFAYIDGTADKSKYRVHVPRKSKKAKARRDHHQGQSRPALGR
jgi:hypothetical protein